MAFSLLLLHFAHHALTVGNGDSTETLACLSSPQPGCTMLYVLSTSSLDLPARRISHVVLRIGYAHPAAVTLNERQREHQQHNSRLSKSRSRDCSSELLASTPTALSTLRCCHNDALYDSSFVKKQLRYCIDLVRGRCLLAGLKNPPPQGGVVRMHYGV
jgi:hypothetical protein